MFVKKRLHPLPKMIAAILYQSGTFVFKDFYH